MDSLATRAKAAFDDPPDSDPWRILQQRLCEYQGRAYGYQPDHRCLLGVFEELDEYIEAETDEAERDAVADATIYLIQYCTAWRLDVSVLINEHAPARSEGKLAHIQLKHEQGIRGLGDKAVAREALAPVLAGMFTTLRGMLGNIYHDDSDYTTPALLDVTLTVAETVMKRVPSKLPRVVP
jgi:hypothetical protein